MTHRSISSIAAITALLTLLPLGCSDSDDDDECDIVVASKADDDTDFTAYKTYAVPSEDDLPNDVPDEVRFNLETAIAAARVELDNLGFEEVALDADPDVVLFTLSTTRTETDIYYECQDGWWYGWWYWAWDPCAWLVPIPVEYTLGSLVVGLADPAEEKVVFGGAAQGILECGDVNNRIVQAVDDIFDEYPQ